MAFSATERTAIAARIRHELGYGSVTVGGEPYFTIAHAPEVALDNLYTGAETTSVTTVTSNVAPTTITLADATGFAAGIRVHVGAGSTREIVQVQSLSGTSLSASFAKPHSGTYSVEVESGESMLRTILANLDAVGSQIASAFDFSGIKKADEVEFFGSQNSMSSVLYEARTYWRNELAALLKLPNMHAMRGNSSRLEAY